MKRSFLLPTLFILLISCNSNKGNNNKTNGNNDNGDIEKPVESKRSVIGNWDVVEMNMDEMDEEEKEDAEKNASIEFRSDGTYTSIDSDDIDGGNYTYDNEAKQLTLTSDEDGTINVVFSIDWKGNKMVMKTADGTAVILSRK